MAKKTPAAAPAQPAGPPGATLDYFDPADIAFGANYRLHDLPDGDEQLDALLGIDEAWTGSLKATGGNMDPVALLRRPPGSATPYVIKYGGARRLRGCAKAGLPVYGYVAGDEDDDDAEALARLVSQWRENHDRHATTAAADAHAIQGMLDLGMTEAAICKAVRLPGGKDTIKAARRVAGSPLAAKAAARYDLDLAQSAVVAEFAAAADTEAVQALVVTAVQDPARFGHHAQALRDNAAERAERRALAAELAAAGVTVVDAAQWANDVAGLRGPDGARLTAEGHAGCPGHAAFIHRVYGGERDTFTAVYICTDPAAYGHRQHPALSGRNARPDLSEAEHHAQKWAARRVREGNKEHRTAKKVRTAWLRTTLAPRVPKAARESLAEAAWTARYLATTGYELRQSLERGHPAGCELLGVTVENPDSDYFGAGERQAALAALMDGASDPRAVHTGLMLVLGAVERQFDEQVWQRDPGRDHDPYVSSHSRQARAYLLFLEGQGHHLSPVEEHIARGQGQYVPQTMAGEPRPGPAVSEDPGTATGTIGGQRITVRRIDGPGAGDGPPAGPRPGSGDDSDAEVAPAGPAAAAGGACILAGTPGENPEDCTTHAHEYDPATQDEPGSGTPDEAESDTSAAAAAAARDEAARAEDAYAGDDAESTVR